MINNHIRLKVFVVMHYDKVFFSCHYIKNSRLDN